MDWFGIGLVLAAISAVLMSVGFWLERRRPGLRWPIVIVGALLGLALGFVMAIAFWAIQVRPHARRVITVSSMVVGAGFVLLGSCCWGRASRSGQRSMSAQSLGAVASSVPSTASR